MNARDTVNPGRKPWSPYVGGALSGLLVVASVWVTGKYFGASTSFVRSAGFVEQVFSPGHVAALEYFVKEAPKVDWQWMFVAGIFAGALLASLSTGTFRWQAVPPGWAERFGPSRRRRGVAAFCGGALSMFGARLADG